MATKWAKLTYRIIRVCDLQIWHEWVYNIVTNLLNKYQKIRIYFIYIAFFSYLIPKKTIENKLFILVANNFMIYSLD